MRRRAMPPGCSCGRASSAAWTGRDSSDAQHDPVGTMQRYKQALALGGTRGLPEIYAAAGARLIFDEAGMRELVDLVEARLLALREGHAS